MDHSPTITERQKLVRESEKKFQKSDESAYSIVPSWMSSRMSTSTHCTAKRESFMSEKDMVYQRLSFENDLFTARVYKRNYRSPMILRLFKPKKSRYSGISRSSSVLDSARVRSQINHRSRDSGDLAESVARASSHLETIIDLQPRLPTSLEAEQSQSLSSTLEPDSRETHLTAVSGKIRESYVRMVPVGAVIRHPDIQEDVVASIPSEDFSRKLFRARERGDHDMKETLLQAEHKANFQETHPDALGLRAIHVAAKNGDIKTVQMALRYGSSIEEETSSLRLRPLHLATQSGDKAMVKFLLQHRAQIFASNKLGEKAIHLAAKSGSVDVLRILVDGGADLECSDLQGWRPLHKAVESSDQPRAVRYLAEIGADINAPVITKNPMHLREQPLNIACRLEHHGNARALLESGAFINGGHEMASPLETVLERGSLGILRLMLEVVVNRSQISHLRRSAVHVLVARADHTESPAMMLILLEHQVDVNVRDENGDTALHVLAHRPPGVGPKCELAKIFLDNKIDPYALNNANQTPLYIAISTQDRSLIMLLIKSGANRLLSNPRFIVNLHVEKTHGSETSNHDLSILGPRVGSKGFFASALPLRIRASLNALGWSCTIRDFRLDSVIESEPPPEPKQGPSYLASSSEPGITQEAAVEEDSNIAIGSQILNLDGALDGESRETTPRFNIEGHNSSL